MATITRLSIIKFLELVSILINTSNYTHLIIYFKQWIQHRKHSIIFVKKYRLSIYDI